jgi:hypothetical protein
VELAVVVGSTPVAAAAAAPTAAAAVTAVVTDDQHQRQQQTKQQGLGEGPLPGHHHADALLPVTPESPCGPGCTHHNSPLCPLQAGPAAVDRQT